jgi:hypothetical protein
MTYRGLDHDSFTEEEANIRKCPINGTMDCIASGCMAWRWSQTKKTRAFSKRTVEIAKEKDLKINEAFDWVWKNEGEKFSRTEGYCGLAGYPHNSVKP